MNARARTILLMGWATLALSACGREKPTGQVIATVNGDEVTFGELRAEAAAHSDSGGAAASMPDLLRTVVDRKLWAQRARHAKRDQEVQYILARRRSDEDQLAGLEIQALRSSVAAPSAAQVESLLKKYPAAYARRTIFLVDQINARAPANAAVELYFRQERSLDKLALDLDRMGILAQRSKTEWNSTFMPADDALKLSKLAPTDLFYRRNGDVLIAATVLSKSTFPLSYAERKTLARQSLAQEKIKHVLAARLNEMRESATIYVQPGYAVAFPQ